jgi:carboxymethylenebutenolidase
MNQAQTFQVNNKPVNAYLAVPESGNGSGIIVLHAWWGLTPFFKEVCQRLTKEGFVALAPDFYHGAIASTIDEAKQLRAGIDREVANEEMKKAVDFLCTYEAVGDSRIGIIGFSLGANYALWLARTKPNNVATVVLFYGAGAGKYDKTQATFLGHFAENDRWGVGPKKVSLLEERLRSAGREVNFYTYPDTEHWFFEADHPDVYNTDAAQLAWERTIKFLQSQLGAK